MIPVDQRELSAAMKMDPNGGTCGFCGAPNTFCDDCGFIYCEDYKQREQLGLAVGDWSPEGREKRKLLKALPTCETCWLGEPGHRDRAVWGTGER